MEPSTPPTPALDPNIESALFCPDCGYDLRATTSGRCSECGLVIDRESLRTSGIPWAHRRRIGRIRAYFKTALAFILDRQSIRHEAGKPQDPADSRTFSRITAIFIAIAMGGLFALAIYSDGWDSPAIEVGDPFGFSGTPTPGWIIDLAVPWSAGALLRPVLPLCLLFLAFHLAGVQRTIFRSSGPPEHRRRAVAIASYTTAPLILMLPAILGLIITWLTGDERRAIRVPWVALLVFSCALPLFAMLFTVIRMVQWLRRIKHCGTLMALFHLAELGALWLLGAILFLGVLPWCVGFVWIVLDSFW